MEVRTSFQGLATGVAAFALLAASALIAPSVQAQTPMPGGGINQPGWFAVAEFRYLEPVGTSLDYGVVLTDNATGDQDADQRSLDYGFAPGLRAGLGMQGNNWDIGVYFAGLWAEGDDSVSVDGATQEIVPTLGDPFFSDTITGTSATVHGELNYYVVDLEGGYAFAPASGFGLRIFGGLRYANLDQEITATFLDLPDNLTVNHQNDTWGVGPRFGFNGSAQIGKRNLHVIGNFAGSLLFGNIETTRVETGFDSGTGLPVSSTGTSDESRIIPMVEAEIGLAYSKKVGKTRHFNLAVGYRVESWIDAVDQAEGADGGGGTAEGSSTMSFHGPFLRAGLRF